MTEAAYIPTIEDTWNYATHRPVSPPSVVIHALRENKRPIGFAPWPAEPKKPRKPRARKAAE